MQLKYKPLFQQASQKLKLPFFKWNDWIKGLIETL